MRVAYGISWDDGKGRKLLAAFIVPLMLASLASAPGGTAAAVEATDYARETVSVIVRAIPGGAEEATSIVEDLGGRIQHELSIINGFSAEVPRGSLAELRFADPVSSVTKNYPLQMLAKDDDDDDDASDDDDDYDDPTETSYEQGSMYDIQKATGIRHVWKDGYCGQGVDVALVDTGVAPVEGLTASGKVINGPDLSFEGMYPDVRYLDTNGHGTHMAGIILGRDNSFDLKKVDDDLGFAGMAPCSRLVSVKVANATGATDVSQVLAAIDWVVQHRNSNGLNIKVLNLSFGTDGTQDYRLDPLTYAVEVAWHRGITVVVAAGNQQFGNTAMNNPAYDPYVIAVGANDSKGTFGVGDDEIPYWSARGDGTRNPDVVAPGKSVISLRVPGSYIDENYGATGRYGTRFFKGSGTSQAAAVVSGAAALIHSQRPGVTPDQVKGLLMQTATTLPHTDAQAQGHGMIDLKKASRAATPNYVQNHERAVGSGSLDAARGTLKLVDHLGNTLDGERDIMGMAWDGVGWSHRMGVGWSNGTWNGSTWTGVGWSRVGWSGVGWSGVGWSGKSWSGVGWSGVGWSGKSWSGVGWSGKSWSGVGWSGVGWSGVGWSGVGWSGVGWS